MWSWFGDVFLSNKNNSLKKEIDKLHLIKIKILCEEHC
jgi:hypothetical protein